MRKFATVALLLGSSTLAFADPDGAPGDYNDDGDYAGPSSVTPSEYSAPPVAPPPVYAAPCMTSSGIPVMARRFAIGLSLGSASFGPEGSPETQDFNVAELSLRYRATYHLELELALTGGRQMLSDGTDGTNALGGGSLNLRYRFAPAAKWNWWLMAGLGTQTIAAHDAPQETIDANYKPLAQLGVGLERRFQRFAIQAELRMVSLGDATDSSTQVEPPMVDVPTNAQPDPKPDYYMTSGKQQGGQFTLGLSYYF